MKNWAITGLACVCTGVLATAQTLPGFELTGLVDLGLLRVACLKSTTGESSVLHLGETAWGVVLKDIDVKGGRVILQQGTNQIQLHVVSRGVSTAPLPQSASVSVLTSRQKPTSNPPPSLGAVEFTSWQLLESGEQSSLVMAPQLMSGPKLDSPAHSIASTTPPEGSAPAIATPFESKPVASVDFPSADSSPAETVAAATENGAVSRSPLLSSAGKTEFWHEGEMIRALYGDAGLSAWQRDQYLKSLKASHP